MGWGGGGYRGKEGDRKEGLAMEHWVREGQQTSSKLGYSLGPSYVPTVLLIACKLVSVWFIPCL